MITVQQPGLHQFEIELFATGRKNKVKIISYIALEIMNLCVIYCLF